MDDGEKLGLGGDAALYWPWVCFLSDIQNSWVGTLAENVPGGCTVGKSAKSFQLCWTGCYNQKPVM